MGTQRTDSNSSLQRLSVNQCAVEQIVSPINFSAPTLSDAYAANGIASCSLPYSESALPFTSIQLLDTLHAKLSKLCDSVQDNKPADSSRDVTDNWTGCCVQEKYRSFEAVFAALFDLQQFLCDRFHASPKVIYDQLDSGEVELSSVIPSGESQSTPLLFPFLSCDITAVCDCCRLPLQQRLLCSPAKKDIITALTSFSCEDFLDYVTVACPEQSAELLAAYMNIWSTLQQAVKEDAHSESASANALGHAASLY